MITLRELIDELCIEQGEITLWIERRWVQPLREANEYYFDPGDVARARLICELRRDLAIDEEALPLVLSLLDQVYGLRQQIRGLCQALNRLSPELQAQIREDWGRLMENAAKNGEEDTPQ